MVRSQDWSLVLVAGMVVAIALFSAHYATRANDGRFLYALDDAYIHMAVARNVAEHGVWGITPHQFSSSTSSLLWPAMLAVCFKLAGPWQGFPLVLNLLFAIASLFIIQRFSRRLLPARWSTLVLMAAALVLPLTALVLGGMEHTLQIACALALTVVAADIMTAGQAPSRRALILLLVLAAINPLTRYENLFVVAAVGVLFLVHRLPWIAVATGAAGILPVALYGVASLRRGWEIVPNGLLVKTMAETARAGQWVGVWIRAPVLRALENPGLLCLAAATLLGIMWSWRERSRDDRVWRIVGIVTLATYVLHVLFARMNWFYRYEAYVVAMAMLSMAGIVRLLLRTPRHFRAVAIACLALAGVAQLAVRQARSVMEAPQAMNDRLLEHMSQARFLREFYPGATVVLNDIGMVAFYAPVRILDLYGLGSMEPLRFRRSAGGYRAAEMESWATREHASIAILKPEWQDVKRRIPASWIEVGSWRIPRNVIFNDHIITFYAMNGMEADRLAANLALFASQLPPGVDYSVYTTRVMTDP